MINTNMAIVVKCKCGGIVAATLIMGGVKIGKGFTRTMAEVHNAGGELLFVNTDETKVKLSGCQCHENEKPVDLGKALKDL